MKHKKEKIIYINFNDEIDREIVKVFMDYCVRKISEHKPDVIYFLLASPGGEVSAGINLYNFLKSISPKIIMHNMGSVDSIGIVVFLAGAERYAAPHTSFLFHGVENTSQKNQSLDLKKVDEIRSKIERDQEKIASIIVENSSISAEEINELFWRGKAKSERFAKEKGIIHEIKSIKLKSKDLFFNFSYKKEPKAV
jgi:ATP-dependent Clp protease protease subunit